MKTTIEHPGRPYLFDRLLDYCHRWWSEPIPYLNEARLFFVPDVPHATANYAQDPELWAWAENHFVLPFQHTAVEDYASCLLLYDLAPSASGLRAPRAFIDCISLDDRLRDAFTMDHADADQTREYLMRDLRFSRDEVRQVCRINVGFLVSLYVYDGNRKFDGVLSDSFLMHPTKGRINMVGDNPPDAPKVSVGKDGRVTAGSRNMPNQMQVNDDGTVEVITHEDLWKEKSRGAMQNVVAAMEELMALNVPGRFVVERTEPKRKLTKKQRRQGKTESDVTQPRPRYLMMTADEIREKFNLPQLDEAGRRKMTQRRRHWRTYPDNLEQWPNAHGKSILIPAWCSSDMEGVRTIGKADYQVRLDL